MKISKTLENLLIDINLLKIRENNPRQGNISKIKKSLKINGQYRPIVVNKKNNEILAGNHTYQAAKELGWEKIAVTWVDVSEEEAQKIVLIDNKSNDDSTYDNQILLDILNDLDNFDGTGYSIDDYNDLFDSINNQEENLNLLDEEADPQLGDVEFVVVVNVNSEDDQKKVLEIMEENNFEAKAMSF